MLPQITELTFLAQLARRFGLPVPEHVEARCSRAEVRDALAKWGSQAVVKADVMSGGRGKAGAVVVVRDLQEAMRQLRRLAAVEVGGSQARTSYITQFIPADLQVYSAITYDSRYLGPSLTVSMKGGVDIELVAAEDKRTGEFRALRKGMGYCWSVAVAACPERGKEAMERWFASDDPDVRWIMKENLRKKRLQRMDSCWVAHWRAMLGMPAP